MNKEEIRQKYEKMARWYDVREWIIEVLVVRRLRKRLLRRASGKVLEIAIGTGKNLFYYSKDCQITGVDISRAMLEIARRRADTMGLKIMLKVLDGETLDFPDRHFDTVVSSLTLCTFPIPRLRSMRWPGCAVLKAAFSSWSTAAATGSGSADGKIEKQSAMRRNSVAIGTENHSTLYIRQG